MNTDSQSPPFCLKAEYNFPSFAYSCNSTFCLISGGLIIIFCTDTALMCVLQVTFLAYECTQSLITDSFSWISWDNNMPSLIQWSQCSSHDRIDLSTVSTDNTWGLHIHIHTCIHTTFKHNIWQVYNHCRMHHIHMKDDNSTCL